MKRIRIGIFGVGRGMDLAREFMLLGADIAAVCDFSKDRLEKAAAKISKDTAVYDDFDAFLAHGLDGVVLANYFHEHAHYAVKCFKKGVHVFSECISNATLAQGVELIRAFEQSGSVYMLAENYPQMIFNREIKRICDGGTLGKILYAEGEYNHPGDPNDVQFKRSYAYFPKHWRNFLPRSYYVTHSLGPVMWATGATPKRVTSFACFAPVQGEVPTASYCGDRASIIMTQNDDGSVFRITGCANFGGHHNAYRVCGTEGQIENLRGMGSQIMLRYNKWSKPEDADEVNLYEPKWNDPDENLFRAGGHGGSDYLTCRAFLDCIRENRQPEHPFHIYSAVNMACVAILAHRSMLQGGKPYDIPDFSKEEDRRRYEHDHLSPFYGTDGSTPTISCCSQADFRPTEEQIELYNKKVVDAE